MFHLMPLVLAILLSSVVAISTMSLLPFHLELGISLKDSLDAGFKDFEAGVEAYMKNNIEYSWDNEDCPPGIDEGNEDPTCIWERVVVNDGSVDETAWVSELTPDYLYIPSLPDRWEWSMGRNDHGLYVCASGPYDKVADLALKGLVSHHSSDRVKIGSNCAPLLGLSKSGIESYGSSSIHVTYWIIK